MIQDLQADSARWEQERRRAQTTAGTLISTDSPTHLARGSNSLIGGRDQRRYGSGGGYGRHEPAPAPRYPGNDAPGYSQSVQWSTQGAPQGAPQIPASFTTGQDLYGGVTYSQHPTSLSVMPEARRPWETGVGAHLGVAKGPQPDFTDRPRSRPELQRQDGGTPHPEGTDPGLKDNRFFREGRSRD